MEQKTWQEVEKRGVEKMNNIQNLGLSKQKLLKLRLGLFTRPLFMKLRNLIYFLKSHYEMNIPFYILNRDFKSRSST